MDMEKGKSTDTIVDTGMPLSDWNSSSPLKGGGIFTYKETTVQGG